MKEEDLKCLLDNSFIHLKEAIENNNCRFHVSLQGDGKPRISEQELKYSFIETFISSPEFIGYTYSVETPTQNKYSFTKKGEHKEPEYLGENCNEGRCGNIDVVLFKGKERVALIEFKANHAGAFEHAKDVCKLENEPGNDVLRFLVEIFESTNEESLRKLEEKLYCNVYNNNAVKTTFIGYSLHHAETGKSEKIVGNNSKKEVLIDISSPCEKQV